MRRPWENSPLRCSLRRQSCLLPHLTPHQSVPPRYQTHRHDSKRLSRAPFLQRHFFLRLLHVRRPLDFQSCKRRARQMLAAQPSARVPVLLWKHAERCRHPACFQRKSGAGGALVARLEPISPSHAAAALIISCRACPMTFCANKMTTAAGPHESPRTLHAIYPHVSGDALAAALCVSGSLGGVCRRGAVGR